MNLKPGTRLRSTVDSTEVIVVRGSDDDLDLRCGGSPMADLAGAGDASGSPDAAFSEGTLVGKRYADEASGIELLCTKAGDGSLSIGDQPIGLKDAKPLPSSD
ncbi:MAG: hypothetical protein ACK5OX_02030 [Desertimonas sp.]